MTGNHLPTEETSIPAHHSTATASQVPPGTFKKPSGADSICFYLILVFSTPLGKKVPSRQKTDEDEINTLVRSWRKKITFLVPP